MSEIQIRAKTYDPEVGNFYSDAPAGLYLTRGDGVAVSVSAYDLAAIIERHALATTLAHSVERAVDELLEQLK
jgi:hypothetical protein